MLFNRRKTFGDLLHFVFLGGDVCGRCIIILITDGRANIDLSTSLNAAFDTDKSNLDSSSESLEAKQLSVVSSGLAVGEISGLDFQNESMNSQAKHANNLTSSSKTHIKRPEIAEEILRIGRQIASNSKLKLLVIDTENKLVGTGIGKQLAKVSKGKYYYVPKISISSMERLTSDAVKGYRAL